MHNVSIYNYVMSWSHIIQMIHLDVRMRALIKLCSFMWICLNDLVQLDQTREESVHCRKQHGKHFNNEHDNESEYIADPSSFLLHRNPRAQDEGYVWGFPQQIRIQVYEE